jgi:biopolymer transport protein ExbD
MVSDDDTTTPQNKVKGRAGHEHRRWRLSPKKHATEHVRAEINVTPLVDVMLVLLIIFMLEALVMGRGEPVPLPTAHNVSTEEDKLQPVVSIDEKGILYVERGKLGAINETSLRDMGDRIQKVWTSKPRGAGRIYVKAAQDITYGQISPVLQFLNRELALQAIDLAVTERKE